MNTKMYNRYTITNLKHTFKGMSNIYITFNYMFYKSKKKLGKYSNNFSVH